MLTTEGETIRYSETPLPLPLRLFMLVLGTGLAVGIPLPFLVLADWTRPSWAAAAAALAIAVWVAAGAFFLRIALVRAVDLRLDPQAAEAIRSTRCPFGGRVDRFPLSALTAPEAFMRDSVDDHPFPILRLRLPHGRPLDICCCRDLAEAEAWRDRIAGMIAAAGRSDQPV